MIRCRETTLPTQNSKEANNLTPVWIIAATRFAPLAYATGMYGIGLVALLVYSRVFLDESVAPINYVGALFIIAGTAVFAFHAACGGAIDVSAFQPRTVGIFIAVFVAIAVTLAVRALRSRRRFFLALTFGLLTGGLTSFDPVLKAVGQYAGGRTALIPTLAWGWIPFVLSFALGTAAFFNRQYAFLRGADASGMVPIQTSTYVFVPVLIQIVALPGYQANLLLAVGVVVIVCGIVMTQMRRPLVSRVVPTSSMTEHSGNIPIFLSILQEIEPRRRLRITIREMFLALVILLLFLFFGKYVLTALRISEPALNIGGGVVLFLIALRMIFPRRGYSVEGRAHADATPGQEPLLIPLAVPLVAGPSAMAMVILFATQYPQRILTWLLALLIAWFASALILLSAEVLRKDLGRRVIKALERLTGMILTTLAVEMLLDGIKAFLAS